MSAELGFKKEDISCALFSGRKSAVITKNAEAGMYNLMGCFNETCSRNRNSFYEIGSFVLGSSSGSCMIASQYVLPRKIEVFSEEEMKENLDLLAKDDYALGDIDIICAESSVALTGGFYERAERTAEKKGLSIIGWDHIHPDNDLRPSLQDILTLSSDSDGRDMLLMIHSENSKDDYSGYLMDSRVLGDLNKSKRGSSGCAGSKNFSIDKIAAPAGRSHDARIIDSLISREQFYRNAFW